MTTTIRDEENLTTIEKNSLSKNEAQGLNNTVMPDPCPVYLRAKNEKVISADPATNALIVLGKDRPSTRASGYGGQGGTNCGSISIVAGMNNGSKEGPRPDTYVDPNWVADAARITISSRTDVDKNLSLVSGKVGNATARSAIAMKADNLRLVARESIKIVTLSPGDELNSEGGELKTIRGIELNAGNAEGVGYKHNNKQFDYIQPIPLGQNLESFLGELLDEVDSLAAVLKSFMEYQDDYNNSLSTHTHPPNAGGPVILSPELVPRYVKNSILQNQQCQQTIGTNLRNNIRRLREVYLRNKNQVEPPPIPISSPYNKTT